MQTRQAAFSLYELLVVLALIVILTTVGWPMFSALSARAQAEAQANLLISHLNNARAQAIQNVALIEICGSADGHSCNRDWQAGWLVRNKSTEQVLASHSLPSPVVLRWRGFSNTIVFHPNGTAPAANGRFQLCLPTTAARREIILSKPGRIRVANITKHDRSTC